MEESPAQPSSVQDELVSQQPVDSPQPEKPPRLTKRIKILIAVVLTIIILLIAGMAGAYWYSNSSQTPAIENESEKTSTPTPTPDPTADWETYISKDYGFTFKYPPLYEIEGTPDNYEVVEKVSAIRKVEVEEGGEIEKRVTAVEFTILPLDELTEESLQEQYGPVTISIINLGGKEVFKIQQDSESQVFSSMYFYNLGPKVLRIWANNWDGTVQQSEDNNYYEEYNQILSTFQFAN